MKRTFRILLGIEERKWQGALCTRIAIAEEREKFSLKAKVSSNIWDPKSGWAKG